MKKNKKSICSLCNIGETKKEIKDELFEYKGKKIVMHNFIVYRCSHCNEAVVDNESIKHFSKIMPLFKQCVDKLQYTEKGQTE